MPISGSICTPPLRPSLPRGIRNAYTPGVTSRATSNTHMNSGIRIKLFIMMVLEFFIWGAWLPPLFHLMGAKEGLNFDATQQAMIGSCFAIASIVGIFFSNQFADSNFASEKFLAFSHLVGGLALIGLYFVKDFNMFFTLMLIHSLFYVPTISVANSLAFANLKNANKEFGIIRMGGTIGWILASVPFYFILKPKNEVLAGAQAVLDEVTKNESIALSPMAQEDVQTAATALVGAESMAFIVAGIASLILALFCLMLPHTPPKPAVAGEDSLAWRKAASLLKVPFILVLFIVTVVDATIHNGYFVTAFGFLADVGIKSENIMFVMGIGQVAEILTMAFLGSVLAKLGWRTTMVLGILGHAGRYAVFAFFPTSTEVIVAVQVLHGICYAFFFATVYIFIDAAFPKDVRASAQGLFNLLILGLGDLAAKWLFVPLMQNWKTTVTVAGVQKEMIDYQKLFLVPVGLAILAAVILAMAFHPPKEISAGGEGGGTAPH
jgi:MFS family permease